MRFIIDKESRTAFILASRQSEEIALQQIYLHMRGWFPNDIQYIQSSSAGNSPQHAFIEIKDQSARYGNNK